MVGDDARRSCPPWLDCEQRCLWCATFAIARGAMSGVASLMYIGQFQSAQADEMQATSSCSSSRPSFWAASTCSARPGDVDDVVLSPGSARRAPDAAWVLADYSGPVQHARDRLAPLAEHGDSARPVVVAERDREPSKPRVAPGERATEAANAPGPAKSDDLLEGTVEDNEGLRFWTHQLYNWQRLPTTSTFLAAIDVGRRRRAARTVADPLEGTRVLIGPAAEQATLRVFDVPKFTGFVFFELASGQWPEGLQRPRRGTDLCRDDDGRRRGADAGASETYSAEARHDRHGRTDLDAPVPVLKRMGQRRCGLSSLSTPRCRPGQ